MNLKKRIEKLEQKYDVETETKYITIKFMLTKDEEDERKIMQINECPK